MGPKKAATGTAAKKATPAEHPPYKDMIKEAILQLKERNGSSRQAIKKYVAANNKGIKESNFDTQFNAALKRGVSAGEFVQPKGPSGPVKLQKKEAVKPAKTGEKATKKAVPKKIVTKKAVTKASTAKPKATATKPKAAAATTKPKKTSTKIEKPAVKKTKTGRVSKTTGTAKKASAPAKKAASKKKAESAATAGAAE